MVPPHLVQSHSPHAESYDSFATQLVRAIGATVGGEALTRALGYRSQDAFRKAQQRGRVPVATFEIEGRRGRFALGADIAAWLWRQRCAMAPLREEPVDAVT